MPKVGIVHSIRSRWIGARRVAHTLSHCRRSLIIHAIKKNVCAAPNTPWVRREQNYHLLVECFAATYCLDWIEFKFVAVFVSDNSHESSTSAVTA
jgi:hypothetical protein